MAANALKDLLNLIISGQLPIESAIGLFALLLASAVMYALPMGILCGVLIVLGRLSAQSEIVAMRASGVSLFRIGLPIYFLAGIGVAVALSINFHFMPRAEVAYQKQISEYLSANPMKSIVPKTFVRDLRGAVVFVNEKKGPIVHDLWVWELDRDQRVTCLDRAESARIEFDEESNSIVLTPFNGWREFRNKDPEDFSMPLNELTWESVGIRFPLDKLVGRKSSRHKVDWLTWTELQSELVRLEKPVAPAAEPQRILDRMKIKEVIQDKLTTAFAIFSFALVAVPLGIKVSRKETSANLGVALLLILAYYFLIVVVKWLDNRPELRPDLLLWIPNLIFIVIGLFLSRRAART